MRRFIDMFSLGVVILILGESFCLVDSTAVTLDGHGDLVATRYVTDTSGTVSEYVFAAEDGIMTVPFWAESFTSKKVCTLVLPADNDLKFSFLNGTCSCGLDFQDDNLIYTFTARDVASFVAEPDMADTVLVAPKLVIGRAIPSSDIQPKNEGSLTVTSKNILSENGDWTGSLELVAGGMQAQWLRDFFNSHSKAEWKPSFESVLLRVSPKARLLGLDYGSNPRNLPEGTVKISIKYTIPEYAVCGETGISFIPFTMNNFLPELMSFVNIDTLLEERKYSFVDECSRKVSIVEKIVVPKGRFLAGGSTRRKAGGEVAHSESSLSQSYAGLELRQELTLGRDIYDASLWKEFKAAVECFKSYGGWVTLVK